MHRSPRRRSLALLGVLLVVVPAVLVLLGGSSLSEQVLPPDPAPAAVAAPAPAPVVAASLVDSVAEEQGAYDEHLDVGDCALLGRRYVVRRGCSRQECVVGAVLGNRNVGAEVCRAQDGHLYATLVEPAICQALGRVWIDAVNFCASNPDRGLAMIPHAPQCEDRRSTYVTHAEVERHYDQCLTPAEVRSLHGLARQGLTSTVLEAGIRARAEGGVLLVGDSIAWRGADELLGHRPDWTVDGYPGRRLRELPGRLDSYAARHEAPTGLVLELGTNASRGYTLADLTTALSVLPATTTVMLVAPYRSAEQGRRATGRVSRWMRSLASTRPGTCVADWRRLAMRHPGALVDGVHPTSANERPWAEWIASRWDRCQPS